MTPAPEQTLREWASHLDRIAKRQLFIEPFRDAISDALVWPDETTPETPSQLVLALRPLFHHRTGLILGEHRPHGDLWQLGHELFPTGSVSTPRAAAHPADSRKCIARAKNTTNPPPAHF